MEKQVTPYNSEDSKKEQVRSMFDNIAPRYDLLNRILSFGVDVWWRKAAVRELTSFKPQHVLDVACGTGDFSIAVHKAGVPKVTGVDIAVEMWQRGNEKMLQKGIADAVQLTTGDAEELQYKDDTFDGATVAFGVRNFGDLEKGLREMRRVLKPGAPLVILEFSKPAVFPVKQLYNFYFKTICPFVGRLVSGDGRAYTYLYESVQSFPEGQSFTAIMEQAGYNQVKSKRFTFGICSLYTGLA